MKAVMIYALTLISPLVLLALMLVMERVERPLRREDVGEQLVGFLDTARAEEVETFVSEGFAPALERYWRRRRARQIVLARRTAPRDRRTPAESAPTELPATY